jgi:hypothetical protein
MLRHCEGRIQSSLPDSLQHCEAQDYELIADVAYMSALSRFGEFKGQDSLRMA